MPELAVKKLPDIPAQRALLTWRDGVETLVISSTLDSESQKLGWIIPLPAVPTSIEKADPGMLKTLAFCVHPQITHDNLVAAGSMSIALAFLLGTVWAVVFANRWLHLILFLLLIWGLLVLVLRGIGTAAIGGQSVLGTSIEKTARVGAYDVTVLRARTPAALNEWLATNQFALLPTRAEAAVSEYIRQGWIFTAIQLFRTESGRNTPHPVKLVFPSMQAVYPWRLTAAVGGTPELELFVVGNERATLKGLPTEHCERFDVEPQQARGFGGQWTTLGHPEVTPLLWPGCVLSKLAGKVISTDDLLLEWSAYAAYRPTIYSSKGAWGTAWMAGNFVLGALAVLGVVTCFRQLRSPGGARFYFWRFGRWVAGAVLLTVVATYMGLPKLDGGEFVTVNRLGLFEREEHLRESMGQILRGIPKASDLSEDQIAAKLLAETTGYWRENPYQGGKLRHESTPGNFMVGKIDHAIRTSVYDRSGHPVTGEF